jgi:hypothetical protein
MKRRPNQSPSRVAKVRGFHRAGIGKTRTLPTRYRDKSLGTVLLLLVQQRVLKISSRHCVSAVLEEHINRIACAGAKSHIRYNHRPTKRKAKRQVPISSVVDVTPSKSTRFAFDELDDEGSPELTAKRQRVWQRETMKSVCSEIIDWVTDENDVLSDTWTDKHMERST